MTFNNRASTMDLLLSRRSAKARSMTPPGPNGDQLRQILSAAMRVPDHGKIAPWRFVVVNKPEQEKLGEVIVQHYLAEKPEASRLELEAMREFPSQAPVLVAVLSAPDPSRSIPLWEQQLSAGAACQNLLLATHALGFAGCWLTGWAAYSRAVAESLGGERGDKIAGFLFLGTPGETLKERPRPEFDDVVSYWRA